MTSNLMSSNSLSVNLNSPSMMTSHNSINQEGVISNGHMYNMDNIQPGIPTMSGTMEEPRPLQQQPINQNMDHSPLSQSQADVMQLAVSQTLNPSVGNSPLQSPATNQENPGFLSSLVNDIEAPPSNLSQRATPTFGHFYDTAPPADSPSIQQAAIEAKPNNNNNDSQ